MTTTINNNIEEVYVSYEVAKALFQKGMVGLPNADYLMAYTNDDQSFICSARANVVTGYIIAPSLNH